MSDYTELIHDLRYCADRDRPDCSICGYESTDKCKDRIKLYAAAAIEALQAQLPKLGEWLNVTDSYSWYGKCSVCGEEFVVDAYYAGGMNYCPNCGAKMIGEQNVE